MCGKMRQKSNKMGKRGSSSICKINLKAIMVVEKCSSNVLCQRRHEDHDCGILYNVNLLAINSPSPTHTRGECSVGTVIA